MNRLERSRRPVVYDDGMCIEDRDIYDNGRNAKIVKWLREHGFTERDVKGCIEHNPWIWVYPWSMKFSFGIFGCPLGSEFCGTFLTASEFRTIWRIIEKAKEREQKFPCFEQRLGLRRDSPSSDCPYADHGPWYHLNTKKAATAWLKEKLKHDGVERLDPDDASDLDFADGLECVIDPKTLELQAFKIIPMLVEEQVHTFSFQAPWGECRLEGTPNKDSEWVTEPDFKKAGVSESDALEAEMAYQAWLDACFDLNWFDPSAAWCPEDPSDLPLGWIENALESLGKTAKFYIPDDEDATLLVSRNRRERALVKKLNPDARELSLKDAVQFVNMNYGDCFYWQV